MVRKRAVADREDLPALQRRVVGTLVAGQILGGLGIGATLSIGAVLATEVARSDAFAGAAATLSTLGAAAVAIPLARLAQRRGRRIALAVGTAASLAGAAGTVAATAVLSFPLLLLGFALLGCGVAVNLQSRFAATDIADPGRRGRDLSLVVWSTTIGSVVGPNLFGPGEDLAQLLGMPPLTGSFAIAVVAQLAATIVYLVGLRPDPYLVSRRLQNAPVGGDPEGGVRARALVVLAIAVLGVSHAVMVSVMSMTPVHLVHHGVALTAVGLTLSLHIAGMFALSPLFGWLSDRVGRYATILCGQALFAASLVVLALGADDTALVTVGLVLLGLGWSASTVAASALLTDLVTGSARPRVQGRSDLAMNVAGAAGGALAGPVLALVGYAGLAWAAGVLVLVLVAAVLTVPRSSAAAPMARA
ncbi:MFS transporter [Planctomonas deserti]|uniref:MFS transporter n=1 Tax=Planctomonas deserti TaxID=2144185 RepID=UPI000D3C6436|nr:MFS transporter [Planctomonas deserti]